MSHTDKDDPYWVKCNDPKQEGRKLYHHHQLFGKPRFSSVRLTEEESASLIHKVDGGIFYPRYSNSLDTTVEPYFITYGFADYDQPKVFARKRIGYYSDFCSVAEGVWAKRARFPSNTDAMLFTCNYHLNNTRAYFHWNRPNKFEKNNYHKSSRNKERSALKKAVKEYGSNEEFEDFDHPNLHLRKNVHYGWWH